MKRRQGRIVKFNKEKNHLVVLSKKKVMVLKGWPLLSCYELDRQKGVWRQKYPSSGWFFVDINDGLVTQNDLIKREREKNCLSFKSRTLKEIETEIDNNPSEKPWVDLFIPDFVAENIEKLKLMNTVPEEAKKIIRKYTGTHWQIASFIARTEQKHALKMLTENPALGFIIANHKYFTKRKDKYRLAKNMLYMKRTKLMKYFKLPQEQWVLNAIGKMKIEDLTIEKMEDFIIFVNRNKAKAKKCLVNANVIDNYKFSALSNILNDIDDNFLIQLIRMENAYEFVMIVNVISDVKRMSVELNQDMRRITSKKMLDRQHHALTRRINEAKSPKRKILLNPPFEGDESIVPIKSNIELFEESVNFKNCSFSYLKDIRSRDSFIYLVKYNNEAGMMEIRKEKKGGAWMLKQLRGKNNAQVSDKIKETAEKWLKKNSIREN